MGASLASLDYGSTYFLVRGHGAEELYCIGRAGRLRLQTKGDHRIELSNLRGYSNVIVIDIRSSAGTIKLDFVPDDTVDYLARIPGPIYDLLLRKDGSIQFFNTEIARQSIEKVVFADVPSNRRMAVSVIYSEGGVTTSREVICDGQDRIAALWLRECLRVLKIGRIESPRLLGAFNDKHFAFADGSILFHYAMPLAGTGGAAYEDQFIAGALIESIELNEGAWWNLYTKSLRVSFKSNGSKSEGFMLSGAGLDDMRLFVATAQNSLQSRR